ncbi:MAG: sn-glycerol-3-phosphate ABC transporter ATP-binding protein UgpC [Roseibium sp.]
MASVSVRDLDVTFGHLKVLEKLNLEVEEGEFIVLLGPSGCGKSTLLNSVAGLLDITDGEIWIAGDNVTWKEPKDRHIGMVFQSYALYPHMSVRQNLSFGLENLKTPKDEIAKKINAAAKMLQIDELMERRPRDLSGGQRQRVAIGRAVVREPRIFLFDEPLSNLDAELRVDMRGEIAQLHRQLGNTMIYVTHDQVEAMTMADKIAVLRSGEVEQFGKPLDLFNDPANIFVAGFIGSPKMNFIKGEMQGGLLKLSTGESIDLPKDRFNVSEGEKVTLGIRPNDIKPGSDVAHGLNATVRSVEQLGGDSYIYAKSASGENITVHRPGQVDISAGEELLLEVEVDKSHLFDTETGLTLRSQRSAGAKGASTA